MRSEPTEKPTPAALVRLFASARRAPWHPVLFAAALVFGAHVWSGVDARASARALLAAVVLVWAIQLVATAAFRRPDAVAIALSLGIFLAVGWQGLRIVVFDPRLWPLLLLFAPAAVLLAIAFVRRRVRGSPTSLTTGPDGSRSARISTVLTRFAQAFLVAGLVLAVLRGVIAADLRDLGVLPATKAAAVEAPSLPSDRPDIWFILLDGHPRADTVERVFGADQSGFLDALEARGFRVASRSRSSYSTTELTLPSLFQMRLLSDVPELAPVFSGAAPVEPTLRAVINDNPAFSLLRQRGYEIVATHPGYEDVALRHADRFLDGGEINEFEFYLLRTSVALDVVATFAPDYLSAEQRARILDGFAAVATEASRPAERPRFLCIHIPAPHLPIVFGAHGESIRAENGLGFYSDFLAGRQMGTAEFARQYRDWLAYLDGLTVEAVDTIVSDNPNAVVVVFSDHGVRAYLDPADLAASDLDAVFANLVAARLPGHESLYPDNVTSVNLLSTVLNEYLGASIPMAPGRTFASGSISPFDLREVPNPDAVTP